MSGNRNPIGSGMDRRNFLRLAGLTGLAMAAPAVVGCATKQSAPPASTPAATTQQPSAPAPALKEISSGTFVGSYGSLLLTLPEVQQKYNLKYTFKPFNSTTDAMLALDQGQLDMGNLTAQHLIRAIDQGIQQVVVVGYAGGFNLLIARADLPVNKDDWAGLKQLALQRKQEGKPLKIAVPTGSMQHQKLHFSLLTAGIDPAKDVSLLNVGFAEHPRAIEAKEVDMAMASVVFGAMSIHSKAGKLFNHVTKTRSGKQDIMWAVPRKLIQSDPDLVQRITSSHYEAIKAVMNDKAKQMEREAKHSGLQKEVAEIAVRDYMHLHYAVAMDDLRGAAKEMFDIGWVKTDYTDKVKDHVDLSFLAKASGETVEKLSSWQFQ